MQAMRDVEQKRKQGTRLQQDLQEEAEDAQNALISQVGQKMQQVINRYARENDLSLILNAVYWFQGGPFVYATAAVDITEAIIQLYDQTYPVETAAGSKPSPSPRTNQPPQP